MIGETKKEKENALAGQKNVQLPEKKLIFKILQRLQVQMRVVKLRWKKSACVLDDRETSSSSAKKIKIIITHLDEQKHRAQVDTHESMQEYVLHFVNWVKDFPQ